jgi:hypothetical protein
MQLSSYRIRLYGVGGGGTFNEYRAGRLLKEVYNFSTFLKHFFRLYGVANYIMKN